MNCIKCQTENITKVKFCKNCGYEFSEPEQKAARKKTLIGKIEWLEDLYNKSKLSNITGHLVFKILSVLVVLLTGISFWINNGINLKLLNSKQYEVFYNEEEQEYYLVTENEETALNLYIPNRIKDIKIIHYDQNNVSIEETSYDKEEEIILKAHSGDYYMLESLYKNNQKDQLKIYVLKQIKK